MVSWALYPALDKKFPAGLSATIVQGELRKRLGFAGVTITDALEAGALKNFGGTAQPRDAGRQRRHGPAALRLGELRPGRHRDEDAAERLPGIKLDRAGQLQGRGRAGASPASITRRLTGQPAAGGERTPRSHATGVPVVAVRSASSSLSLPVSGPGRPSPITRPSMLMTGAMPPIVPVTNTSSAVYSWTSE